MRDHAATSFAPTATSASLSPKERLARSRAALMLAMGYRTVGPEESPHAVPIAAAADVRPASRSARIEAKIERSVIGRWWRRSHLSTVAEIGRPFLQDYASRHPAKLMGFAAGTGALIVLVRPWRLVSLGMAAGLLMRSTDLRGLVADYLLPQQLGTDGELDVHP